MRSEVPQLFPRLRGGLIEAAAQGGPWVWNEIVRRYRAEGRACPQDLFGDHRVFVTWQTDEDSPWLLNDAGDRCWMIGTDDGHADPSAELEAISVLKAQEGMDQATKDRIFFHNPMALDP